MTWSSGKKKKKGKKGKKSTLCGGRLPRLCGGFGTTV